MPTSFLSALTGSFASPAAENPTVVMIEAAYRHHGLDARYINCDVAPAALGDAVRGARAMGWAGFNCSLPHKVAVIEHLDGLADSAAVIGAVNCAVRRDGRYIGENTDGQGFLAALKTVVDPAGQSVVIFGAGGAARACAVETALAGAAEITIVNRNPDRGAELVAVLNERTPARAELDRVGRHLPRAGVGGRARQRDVDRPVPGRRRRARPRPETLRPDLVVADIIPNPPRTRLVRAAEERGATVLDGMGMLVNQGVISIRHWTGADADPGVMRRAVEAALGISAGASPP